MCGRFTLKTDLTDYLKSLYDFGPLPQAFRDPARYNIAPSQPVLAIVADPRPRIDFFEWGFLPTWAKPGGDLHPVINARAETIAEKPYFSGAYRSARCAILADGFYEWMKVGKEKQPYHIRLKEGEIFSMAGLWGSPRTPDGAERFTCAIITVAPNAMMKPIHDRMPAILSQEDVMTWIDPKASSAERKRLLEPFPADRMEAFPVSAMVNDPRNDLPDCVRSIVD